MKKRFFVTLSLLVFLSGCTKKQEEVKEEPKEEEKVIQQVQTDEELFKQQEKELEAKRMEEFKTNFFTQKTIDLKNYEEVYSLTQEISNQIKSLLKNHEIGYVSSNDNSLIVSNTYSYQKLEKTYIRFFMQDINVDYNTGVGSFDLIIDKDFHRDLKIDTTDNYIALMYDIYKTFDKNIEKAEFDKLLEERIKRVSNGSYNSSIKADGIEIKVSKEDNMINVRLDMKKQINVEPLEVTTKEYETLADFKRFSQTIFKDGNNINKVLLKNADYRYTYLYEGFYEDNFYEELGFKFRQKDRFSMYKTTTSQTIKGEVLRIDAKSYDYLDELISKFNNTFNFYIEMYMSEKQFADSIQKLALKQNLLSNKVLRKRYDLEENFYMPIPGFMSLEINNDIVTFKLKRNVIAEKVTGR